MSEKKIVLEFIFEEEHYPDEDWSDVRLVRIERTRSDLTPDQIDALGEGIAQSDYWQVDQWNNIQQVLGDSATTSVKV